MGKDRQSTNPILNLYGQVQEIWNEYKGLDWQNQGHNKRTLKRIENFALTLPDTAHKILTETSMLREIYCKGKDDALATQKDPVERIIRASRDLKDIHLMGVEMKLTDNPIAKNGKRADLVCAIGAIKSQLSLIIEDLSSLTPQTPNQ